MINRDAPDPPYLQLAAIIRDRIRSGELAPGSRLPTILELSGTYDVAASTVRKAITTLKSEALVTGRPGWGMFVAEKDQSER